jgi:D-lactate dehydrogenase (cytochrome)
MSRFNALDENRLEQLRDLAGASNVSTGQADLDLHAKDQSHHAARQPEVVIYATDTQQVARILQFANEACIPVTPWGVGTSLEGNPIPVHGGILLSFEKMTQIVKIHADDFQVTTQPGIGRKDLNVQLARHGLFFAPDPGANATIGGMLANNAAGIQTVKYGATKDNVVQMQVVLADGRILRLGSRSVKQSSGYNLMQLIVGSEGTLGVITEATLKLAPVPEHMSAVVAAFSTVTEAVEAVVAVRGCGIVPAALELLDTTAVTMLNTTGDVDLAPHPSIFMEFHAAHETSLTAELDLIREICKEIGAINIQATADPTERKRLWHARHALYENAVRQNPGKTFYVNDVAVPISAYPELIAYIEQQRDAHGMTAYLVGHAGDGNIHMAMPYEGETGYQNAQALNSEVVNKAIELNGTATGEHGVGLGKIPFMTHEHGDALIAMRQIKDLLDPNGILNPGKIFPEGM